MRFTWWFLRTVVQVLMLTFCSVRVFDREKVPRAGGALLVGNHQSFLDPMLLAFALPREAHFMARDSLFRNPAFRGLISHLNAFPVKRGKADLGAMKEALRRLKNGGLLTVFPEATRSPDGSVGRMQSGVVLLARKARVPLVPAMILGAFEAWPRQSRLPHPSHIRIAYGEPLTPEQMKDMTDDACIACMRDRIIELMAEHCRRLGRKMPPPRETAADPVESTPV